MDIRLIVINAFAILFAITVHEAAHAWTSNKMGDPTAAALGRTSLNPLVHIDLMGTVIFPLMLILLTRGRGPIFGWAKPVPYNPYNLRRPKRGGLWISFAGPIANILTAGVAVLVFRGLRGFGIPMPYPFSGAITAPSMALIGLAIFLGAMAQINITLAVFNLIPVPPLDGSGILAGLLSGRAAEAYERFRPYGFIVLMILIITRITDLIFIPISFFLKLLFA